jgi:carboxymethylenebutenolidase
MGIQIELTAADGHKLAAWRAEPKGKPRGALVVVQEIFGVNSHIRGVTDAYAADGYLAIAPALFDRVQRGVDMGYSPADIEVGRTFIPKMQWDNTLKDVAAAIGNVKSAGKIGVLGYCWGGTVAWVAAARLAGLDCAVAYYGGGIPNMIDEEPQCPVMFHWGETDHAISVEAARKVAAAHPGALSYVYKAGHGFNCDQRGSYDAESARLARTRSLEFLRKHIG